jgi:hypothetical protein
MAHVSMEAFQEGTEIVRVYLAATLRESHAVEDVLSGVGVDFAVEVEAFASPTALGLSSTRRAAGFWIRDADLDHATTALERAGHVAGLVQR